MYIDRKPLSVGYKIFLGLVSGLATWLAISQFGSSSWRVFVIWVLTISTIYYIISAFIIAFDRKRSAGRIPCPMLEGLIIINLLLAGVTTIIYYIVSQSYHGVDGWAAGLIYASLPIFAFIDWLFFAKKGRWQPIDPFYWLALPVTYVGIMIATAEFSPTNIVELRYPLDFLNYAENGLLEMLGWLMIFGILILSFSYLLVTVDALAGGRVAKHIVLPRIKTVIIDDASLVTETITSENVDQEPIVAEPIIIPDFKAKK